MFYCTYLYTCLIGLYILDDFCVQLTLSAGIGSSPVVVMVIWTGNDVNHVLNNTMQQISGAIIIIC